MSQPTASMSQPDPAQRLADPPPLAPSTTSKRIVIIAAACAAGIPIVLLAVGILVAIAIPVFLNASTAQGNADAIADTRNAAAAVEATASQQGSLPASFTPELSSTSVLASPWDGSKFRIRSDRPNGKCYEASFEAGFRPAYKTYAADCTTVLAPYALIR